MKNIPIPEEGIISLRHLANYLGIRKVENLVQVLSYNVLIIKLGKFSTSLINVKELKKCWWCNYKDRKWVVNLKKLRKELRSLRKASLRKAIKKPLEALLNATTQTLPFSKEDTYSSQGVTARNSLLLGGAN